MQRYNSPSHEGTDETRTETDSETDAMTDGGTLLTAPKRSEYVCECGFRGSYWDFDQINPIKEHYRQLERDATTGRERQSARKNRIHAPYKCTPACPKCGEFGDAVTKVDQDRDSATGDGR